MERRTLEEVINEMAFDAEYDSGASKDYDADVLYYLKEYKTQKRIYQRLYKIFNEMFYWVGEGFALDGNELADQFFTAYRMGFDDEDA